MVYRGPKARLMRRFGEAFSHSPKHIRILERRPHPPGQHGAKRRRERKSEYGRRLFEKQKLKAIYNISETQMTRYMREAARRQGSTGTNLLQLLETRLDNVVYRMGLTPTIWSARQLVSHGHMQVNGERVDIPSFKVKPGDVVSISEKMKGNPHIQEWINSRPLALIPPYLRLDRENMAGGLLRIPDRDEMPVNIDESLIVEFYSR
jgi:small subunit ribosomal protein S4